MREKMKIEIEIERIQRFWVVECVDCVDRVNWVWVE
jgi:hypothetical protein